MVKSIGQFKVSERSEMARRWMAARRRLASHVGVWHREDQNSQESPVAHLDLTEIDESRPKIVQALEEEGLLRARDLREGSIADASEWASQQPGRLGFFLGGSAGALGEASDADSIDKEVAAGIVGLRDRGFSEPIAIIDLDCRHGNGNRERFADDASILTYSLQEPIAAPTPALADVLVEVPAGTQGGEYLSVLRKTLLPAMRSHAPKLVFYLAGRNMLGGAALDAFQLSQRGVFLCDQLVLELAMEMRSSTVVTLAGVDSPRAWQCSARMLRWALTDSIEALR